jgi:hypothetical protein
MFMPMARLIAKIWPMTKVKVVSLIICMVKPQNTVVARLTMMWLWL